LQLQLTEHDCWPLLAVAASEWATLLAIAASDWAMSLSIDVSDWVSLLVVAAIA
jgi:hypothetical protein